MFKDISVNTRNHKAKENIETDAELLTPDINDSDDDDDDVTIITDNGANKRSMEAKRSASTNDADASTSTTSTNAPIINSDQNQLCYPSH